MTVEDELSQRLKMWALWDEPPPVRLNPVEPSPYSPEGLGAWTLFNERGNWSLSCSPFLHTALLSLVVGPIAVMANTYQRSGPEFRLCGPIYWQGWAIG
jgi:hypothetical protein